MIRAALVDNLALVRQGVRTLLATAGDIEVVGEGTTSDDAVSLTATLGPDVLLIDRDVQGLLRAIRTVKERLAAMEVVVMTNALHQIEADQVVAAGASGYVCKDISPETLIDMLRSLCYPVPWPHLQVAAHAVTPAVPFARPPRQRLGDTNGLTSREIDILAELARGSTDREIAGTLSVGEGTVKTHIRHILHKLGVRNRTEAIAYALRRRLIE